jgi:hypothetical protein
LRPSDDLKVISDKHDTWQSTTYHSLTEVFEKEGQRRGGVSHGIGAVQHHEGIKTVIIQLDFRRNPDPVCRNMSAYRDLERSCVPSFSMLLLSSSGFH